MGSALVVALAKYGLLAMLWLFVIGAFRTIRVDLWGRPAERPAKAPKPKQHKGSAHKLVVTEGALQGTTVTLTDQPVTLGRGDGCTLVLTDDYASTSHARLAPEGSGWVLEDLGSTNGTYLGKTRVTRPVPVPLKTPIRIGKTVLELRA
jgi:pSer/pThr/pTyr-binding forkhead associated (FHA) protein